MKDDLENLKVALKQKDDELLIAGQEKHKNEIKVEEALHNTMDCLFIHLKDPAEEEKLTTLNADLTDTGNFNLDDGEEEAHPIKPVLMRLEKRVEKERPEDKDGY